jgi:hypothetical protein
MRIEDKNDMLKQLDTAQQSVMNGKISSIIIIGVTADRVDDLGKDVFTSHVISTQEDAAYLCARMTTLLTELSSSAEKIGVMK